MPYLQNVLEGGSAAGVFDALGHFMDMSIQRSIADGGFAAFAPSTIKKKGHSKPLLDTGAMYGAVTWKKV